ncbi:Uncharacterised protein at_DN2332 [Pycnogonum litorale]
MNHICSDSTAVPVFRHYMIVFLLLFVISGSDVIGKCSRIQVKDSSELLSDYNGFKIIEEPTFYKCAGTCGRRSHCKPVKFEHLSIVYKNKKMETKYQVIHNVSASKCKCKCL